MKEQDEVVIFAKSACADTSELYAHMVNDVGFKPVIVHDIDAFKIYTITRSPMAAVIDMDPNAADSGKINFLDSSSNILKSEDVRSKMLSEREGFSGLEEQIFQGNLDAVHFLRMAERQLNLQVPVIAVTYHNTPEVEMLRRDLGKTGVINKNYIHGVLDKGVLYSGLTESLASFSRPKVAIHANGLGEVFGELAEMNGYNAVLLTDDEHAYRIFHPEAKRTPNVLLVDVSMKKGAGFDVISNVRAVHPELPIVATIKFGATDDEKAFVGALGATEIVEKPDVKGLVSTLGKYMPTDKGYQPRPSNP